MVDDFETVVLPALERAAPGAVRRNADLSQMSRWKIGGAARVVVEPPNAQAAAAVMAVMADRPEPLFVMGDASNVLFDSAGFDGVILRIGHRMQGMRIEGTRVWAEAGIWVPLFARRVGCAGLSGIEHTIGIPGTLGGLVLMNGGSQRKGIGLNVVDVLVADEKGNLRRIDREEAGFAYRTSSLQYQRAVIVEANFELTKAPVSQVRCEMIRIMAERRAKFPKNLPNCGSTFLSDPAMYATVGPPGRAIEQADLKGLKRGGAQISSQHGNFIVNNGGASSEDVLALIATIRQTVHRQTGHLMDCEVRHVRPDGEVRPAHVTADELFGQSGEPRAMAAL
ncbi:MAG: UDP-N-acetylenolpyruvoylglucosamine reductase [Pelagibacterium sp. SCN 63-23]|nr:MAG: UDP-N-acetylenolpyruvoylglucosamine reductase [Pelagibacterium sp. SCN 63-23]